MAMQNLRINHANRHQLLFDGYAVAFLESVSPDDDYGVEPQSGIGDIHVQEHTPSVARHTINVQGVIPKTRNLKQLGVLTENGDIALTGKVFDIVLVNLDTGSPARTYRGCTCARVGHQISKHRAISFSATFMALDVNGTDI